MNITENIPADLINFTVVAAFSLLIGLEQRRRHLDEPRDSNFGMDRTFTMIGILGFVLYRISPGNLMVFTAGGIAITVFLAIYYYKRIENQNKYGLTSIVIVLITYSLAPLIYLAPLWLSILVVSVIFILTQLKQQFRMLSGKFDDNEFITLAKFLVISGIILPLLPNSEISDLIPVSPFKFWLAVVVVSGISYLSYILKKFVFPKNGILITGVLGGMYSSTATSVVLARKSKDPDVAANQIASSVILATGMMFIRIFAIVLIFNADLAKHLIVPFSVLTLITFITAGVLYRSGKKGKVTELQPSKNKNPLEFNTAMLFAFLFVLFSVVTKYVLGEFGTKGLDLLALIVGVTDIDPFLVSLFSGKYQVTLTDIANATLIAISSNNLMKLGYVIFLGDKSVRIPIITGFSIIIAVCVLFVFI
ncbi:MAG: DUF4010 domain-containing protein [Chlorobi bacterium]|nr:DUF4010 domain-containing protein [Chlorobiota bacterium]